MQPSFYYPGRECYTGQWLKSKRDGYGKFSLPGWSPEGDKLSLQDTATGRWQKPRYDDGAEYEGRWVADLRHGQARAPEFIVPQLHLCSSAGPDEVSRWVRRGLGSVLQRRI